MNKIYCMECVWQGNEDEVDIVIDPRPLPGTVPDHWRVCPQCRMPENLRTACEAIDCWQGASNGMRWPDGVYRWTCSNHTPRGAVTMAIETLTLFGPPNGQV